jgi:hypothetical protein
LTFEQERIRFVAPISDLATKEVVLVGRDGTEIPLFMKRRSCDQPLTIREGDVDIKTVDQTNSLVKLTIRDSCFLQDQFTTNGSQAINPPLLLVVGNRVFGYSDAPLVRGANSLTAVVPTALLIANPRLLVKSLFQQRQYGASIDITGKFGVAIGESAYLLSQPDRLVFLGQNEKDSTYEFALYGNRLGHVKIVTPLGVPDPELLGTDAQGNTIRKIRLKAGLVNTQKYLILQREAEQPFIVPIPSIEAKDSGPQVKPIERVTVGTDSVVIKGEGLKDLTKVTFNDTTIIAEKAGDGSSVQLKGLVAKDVTTTPTTKTLVFWFNDKKVEVKLEVVNAKVETVAK